VQLIRTFPKCSARKCDPSIFEMLISEKRFCDIGILLFTFIDVLGFDHVVTI
jgi:hypothetical protein